MSDQKLDQWSVDFKLSSVYQIAKCFIALKNEGFQDSLEELGLSKLLVIPSFFNKKHRVLHYMPHISLLEEGNNLYEYKEALEAIKKKKELVVAIKKAEYKIKEAYTSPQGGDFLLRKKAFSYVEKDLRIEQFDEEKKFIDKFISGLDNQRDKAEALLMYYFHHPVPLNYFSAGGIYKELGRLDDKQPCPVFYRSKNPSQGKRDIFSGMDDNSFTIEYSRSKKYAEFYYGIINCFFDKYPKYEDLPNIIFPIYDIYIGKKGYGGIKGFLSFYYYYCDEEQEENKFKEQEENKFSENLARILIDEKNSLSIESILVSLSQELFHSQFRHIQKRFSVVGNCNIVKNFIEVISDIQDWKALKVVDKDKKVKYRWEKEEKEELIASKGYEEEQYKYFQEKHISGNELISNDDYDYFFNIKDIKIFLTATEEEEYGEFLEWSIHFKKPEVFFIPVNGSDEYLKDKLREQWMQLFEIVIYKWRDYKATERLAASAIMARNVSHNIGSHVLASVISEIQRNIGKIRKELEEPNKTAGQLQRTIEKVPLSEEKYKKILSLFGPQSANELENLLYYLQIRMDHLAEIATYQGESKQAMSLDFCNVEKDFVAVGLLLKYISGVQDIAGTSCEFNIKKDGQEELKPGEKNSIHVAIPNGNTGIHAFYIICENCIRNIAKHNTNQINENTKIKLLVNIEEENEYSDLIKVTLGAMLEQINENGKNDEEKVKKTNSLNEQLKEINGLIKTPVINENLQLRDHAWGIAEMVMSAEYLYNKPRNLKAIVKKTENGVSYLAYEFYMSKPKEVLIIADGEPEYDNEKLENAKNNREELRSIGIKWVNNNNEKAAAKDLRDYRRLIRSGNNNEKQETDPLRTFCVVESKNPSNNQNELCNELCKEELDLKIEELLGEGNLHTFLTYLDKKWLDSLAKRHPLNKDNEDNIQLLRDDDNEDNIQLLKDDNNAALGKYWCETELEKGKYNLLYHHHQIPDENNKGVKFSEVENEFYFIEVNQNRSNIDSVWLNQKDALKSFYECEFKSAALAKIVILDERIQEAVIKESNDKKKYSRQWVLREGKNRIFVPQDIKLFPNPKWQEIKDYIDGQHTEKDPIDCIVIHWGVLEALEKVNEKGTKETKELMIKILQGKEGDLYKCKPPLSVRFCTGRGRLPGILDKSSTIPFSELSRWVISEGPSKYHLCRLLNL